jgi:hypothetical protein
MSGAMRDFMPKGKLWVADNNVTIGQALKINIKPLDKRSGTGYLNPGCIPRQVTSQANTFRISQADAQAFDGLVGVFVAAHENVLVGFSNGMEFMFHYQDVDICDGGPDSLTPIKKLPELKFDTMQLSAAKTKQLLTNSEIVFYDSVVNSMLISDGTRAPSEIHAKALALLEKRREVI